MENKSFLKTIPFTEFSLWDVKRYILSDIQSSFRLVSLSKLIYQRNEKIKLFEFPDKDFKILGVNNKIGLFDAYIEKGKNINQPYKKVYNGDLIYNPYRVNVGSIGMKTPEIQNELISPAYVVFGTRRELLSGYLYLIFKTEKFNKIINDNTTGSVRQNLKFDTLEKIKIPLPTIEEQKQLIYEYNKKINLAGNQKKRAVELENEIERYLFKKLKIKSNTSQSKSKGLNFVKFSKLNIWGADRLLRGGLNSMLKSDIFPMKKVSDLAYINPKTDITKLDDGSNMSFLPMRCISDTYGEVIFKEKGVKHKSNGYTKFFENDLIWARITPCMQNGKSAIVSNLENSVGYGSTEFHVLRKKSENLSIRYLYHLLRTKSVRGDAVNYFTGSAGQQRVPKTYLENLFIPVPPFNIQNKISDHINDLKSKIKHSRINAEKYKTNAIDSFEKEIFN